MRQLDEAAAAGREIADALPPILKGVGVLLALQVAACLALVYLVARRA